MATLYASAPGTGSGGSGTSGSPYGSVKTALEACSPGDTLKLKPGTYTYSMAWNSVTWPSGSSGSVITVEPETFTADTTHGVPGGTSSVIWKTTSGSAINFGVAGCGYWSFRGIVFDADNYTGDGYISFNYGNHHIEFRNNLFRNMGRLVATVNYAVMIQGGNTGASTAVLNNAFRYNEFSATGALPIEAAHWIYWRSSGSTFEHNTWDGSNGGECGIQFFASNGAGYSINNNIVRFNIFKDFSDFDDNNAVLLFGANASSNLVYGNLIYNCPTRIGIDFRGGSGVSGTTANNTATYNTVVGCLRGVSVGTSDSIFTNTLVHKNILYDNGTLTSHNLVDNGTSTVKSNNSIDGTDPQFTNTAINDYTLSASSPAGLRANAFLVGDISDDFDITGASRDATEPSMGAYEYDAAATPEPPVNVYANPGGYTITRDVATVIGDLSVSHAAGLVVECWLSLESANATWTDVDTSGGATSN